MKSLIVRRELLADLISCVFVLLFVYAAISKLADFQKFQVQLGQSPILSPFLNIVDWFVPLLEIGIAVLFIFKRSQLTALYLSFSLMVVFTTYILIILNFSSYIPCSCGGILQKMSWRQHLVFNICFVLLGCIGVLVYPSDQRAIAIEGEAENLKIE